MSSREKPSGVEGSRGFAEPLRYAIEAHVYFITSSTALVIPMMPTRIVGSGTGANLLEYRLGSGTPVFFDSATFAGSTAPTTNMSAGMERSGRLYSQKSSAPILGSFGTTSSLPNAAFSATVTRLVSSG